MPSEQWVQNVGIYSLSYFANTAP